MCRTKDEVMNKITLPIEINISDILYQRHGESDVDPSDTGNDRITGYSHEVKSLFAVGVDGNGNKVRVDILRWSGLKDAIEEEMDNT